MRVTKIEIIWDHDHGVQNEGFYIRRSFADGHEEDENIGESDLTLDSTDAEVLDECICLDEIDIPVEIKR